MIKNNFSCNHSGDWILSASYFVRQAGSTYMHDDLERSSWNFDLRSKSHDELGMSCCSLFDVSWRNKRNDEYYVSLYQQYMQSCRKHYVTYADLRWPFTVTSEEQQYPGSSMVTFERMMLKKCCSFDAYLLNRKHLPIFPLIYNGRRHVTYLTLDHKHGNSETYILQMFTSL